MDLLDSGVRRRVAVGGKPVLMKASGWRTSRRKCATHTETIFESESVAKQFTAMAVQLPPAKASCHSMIGS